MERSLSQRTLKMQVKTQESGSTDHPKASPETTREPKNARTLPETKKNMNLGGRSSHHAGQKTPKWDLQKKPRRPKMEYLYGEAENLNFGCSSKPSRSTFLKQNQPLFRTVGKTYRTVTSPLIFEGCTIRFACFGNPRPPGLALRNTP